MATEPKAVQPATDPAAPASSSTKFKRKTLTNWQAFIKAGLVPKRLVCDGYVPVHPHNQGCHSALLVTAAAVERHVDADHGGGFQIFLRRSEVPWIGWEQFADLGLESHDFRCEICDAELPFSPQHILKHMEPHRGKVKRIRPGGEFWITIRKDKPAQPEDFE